MPRYITIRLTIEEAIAMIYQGDDQKIKQKIIKSLVGLRNRSLEPNGIDEFPITQCTSPENYSQ